MKHLQGLIILFLSLFIFSNLTFGNNDDKPGVIKGIIIDKTSGKPMEYANIAIYSVKDSSLVTGGITNDKGQFTISGMQYGSYYLEANFIGFETNDVYNIVLDNNDPSFDAGKITLNPSAIEIGGIDIVADKAAVEYKLDKKVVNVSQNINAAGGTAVDALENTPAVQVDIEGNVSVRGSDNFTVLIDGRPSVLTGSDALRQIPASALENIEIITNPSAKYEPDGNAGIINLVTKKNSMNGFNGIVNASIGTKDKYRGDVTLNYRTEKFNFTTGIDWRDETHYGTRLSNRESYSGDTIVYLTQSGDRNFMRGGNTYKGGVDYFMTDNTTLSVSGEFGHSKNNRGGNGLLHEYSVPGTTDIYSTDDENTKSENDYYSATMNFQHNFDKKTGHKLEATAYYSSRSGLEYEEENELLTDEDYNPTGGYLARTQSSEDEDEQELRLKADYTLPINKQSRFEAGYQSRMEKDLEDISFEAFDTETNTWIDNDYFSSKTDFRRNIHAIYSTYSNKIGAFEFMGGLRGELTDRRTVYATADSSVNLNRFDLFPTLHTSFDIGEKNELMASYSRRINRPRGRDLDPVPSYYNRYTIRIGNPDLKPEYTNSYELGYMRKFGSSYISLEAFHRVTSNKIENLESLGDDDIYYLNTTNIAKDYSTGVELMGNFDVAKWLLLNASVTTYHYKIEGDLGNESIDRVSTNYGGQLNGTFKFSMNSRLQVQGFYRGPSVSAQGESKSSFYSNLAYKQDFWDKKLTATVKLQDPFKTAKYESESYGDSFKNWSKWNREPRVLTLTLSYKLNNFKEDRKNNDSGRDEGMNMDGGDY